MPKKNCNNNHNKIDIAVLDNRVKTTEKFIEDMQKNHLPHLYEGLNSIQQKMAYWAGGIMVLIVLSQILVKFL